MVLASPIPGAAAEDSDNAVETELAPPANGEDHQVRIIILSILSCDSGAGDSANLLKMRAQFQHERSFLFLERIDGGYQRDGQEEAPGGGGRDDAHQGASAPQGEKAHSQGRRKQVGQTRLGGRYIVHAWH